MNDVTKILAEIESGDAAVAGQLLPLVYEELRKLAAARLAQEKPGQTLQATALVHEAYLRLVDVPREQPWDSRGHFFAAAAEAMRRILVDAARRKQALKHGGGRQQVDLLEGDQITTPISDELLDLNEALVTLEESDSVAAEVVKLRLFAGMTMEEIAEFQEVSVRTVQRHWAYARAWLGRELEV